MVKRLVKFLRLRSPISNEGTLAYNPELCQEVVQRLFDDRLTSHSYSYCLYTYRNTTETTSHVSIEDTGETWCDLLLVGSFPF